MEPIFKILTEENDSLKNSESHSNAQYFHGYELAEKVMVSLEELAVYDIFWSDIVYKVVEDTEAKRIKALLREMRVRMLKPIGSVKRLKRILFSHISLLFGMCSSQSSLIISAFFGNSLSRIPSL